MSPRHGEPPNPPDNFGRPRFPQPERFLGVRGYWQDPDLWDGLYGDMNAYREAERLGQLPADHFYPGEYEPAKEPAA